MYTNVNIEILSLKSNSYTIYNNVQNLHGG
jgi:hypothetical protein